MILLNLELFLLTLRREREEKADDSKRFELTEETAHLKSSRLIQVVTICRSMFRSKSI